MAYATKAKANAYARERNRPHSIEEDFMHNLLAMGAPSSTLWHDEKGQCDIGGSRCYPAVMT